MQRITLIARLPMRLRLVEKHLHADDFDDLPDGLRQRFENRYDRADDRSGALRSNLNTETCATLDHVIDTLAHAQRHRSPDRLDDRAGMTGQNLNFAARDPLA